MAQQISIATKSSGDTLTAGEVNTIVEGVNATVTAVNENKSAADLKNQEQDNALGNKVDKVTGKGLSTEDYTSEEKTKLGNIAENANNYEHPSGHSIDVISETADKKVLTAAEREKIATIDENYSVEANDTFPATPLVLPTGFNYLLIFDIAGWNQSGEKVLKREIFTIADNDRAGSMELISTVVQLSTFANDADVFPMQISDNSDNTLALTFACNINANIRLSIRPIPVTLIN